MRAHIAGASCLGKLHDFVEIISVKVFSDYAHRQTADDQVQIHLDEILRR